MQGFSPPFFDHREQVRKQMSHATDAVRPRTGVDGGRAKRRQRTCSAAAGLK